MLFIVFFVYFYLLLIISIIILHNFFIFSYICTVEIRLSFQYNINQELKLPGNRIVVPLFGGGMEQRMSRRKRPIIEYRHYNLPLNFPVLLLSGDRWRISDIKSGRLHFHNCLEIGICHTDSGIMEFEDVPLPFKAGDITCVPKHLSHTTYSAPGTESLWSYIFVDPEELFRNMFSNQAITFDRPMAAYHNFHLIMNKEEYPKVYFLATSIVEELKSQRTNYQASVKGLMLSLYVELLRIHTKEEALVPVSKEQKKEMENINIIINALEQDRKSVV